MVMPDRFRQEYDEIPRSALGVQDEPSQVPPPVEPVKVSLRQFAQDTVVICVLIAVVIWNTLTMQHLDTGVDKNSADLLDSKVRGCTLLAQSEGYFPPSCTDTDVVAIYARDIIDFLQTTGPQGEHRQALCDALDAQGIRDTDC